MSVSNNSIFTVQTGCENFIELISVPASCDVLITEIANVLKQRPDSLTLSRLQTVYRNKKSNLAKSAVKTLELLFSRLRVAEDNGARIRLDWYPNELDGKVLQQFPFNTIHINSFPSTKKEYSELEDTCKRLNNVEYALIFPYNHDDKTIASLVHLAGMRSLYLNCKVNNFSFPSLSLLTQLRSLQFENMNDEISNNIKDLKLEKLELRNCGLTNSGFENICRITSLTSLTLFDALGIVSFQNVSNLINLRCFYYQFRFFFPRSLRPQNVKELLKCPLDRFVTNGELVSIEASKALYETKEKII